MKKYKLIKVLCDPEAIDFIYKFLNEEGQLESVRLVDASFYHKVIVKVETYLTTRRLYKIHFEKSKINSIMIFEKTKGDQKC